MLLVEMMVQRLSCARRQLRLLGSANTAVSTSEVVGLGLWTAKAVNVLPASGGFDPMSSERYLVHSQ